MNTLRNSVRLIGNVGQDPVIKVLESGRKFASFSLATHENYLTALGEKVEKTYWHSIVFWNRSAELVEQHVTKGSHLLVEGQLTYRSWEDKAGVKHFRTEIRGKELLLL